MWTMEEYPVREIFFSTKRVHDENGEELKLDYYITVGEAAFENGTSFESYGVKIVMTRENGEKEMSQIDDIFVNSLEIDELVMLLSKYTVTPMSLYEIMDDYLAG